MGIADGVKVGLGVGDPVGQGVGMADGVKVGLDVGDPVGQGVGMAEGVKVGLAVGLYVGLALGLAVSQSTVKVYDGAYELAGSGGDHNRSTQPVPGASGVHVSSGATGHGSEVGADVGAGESAAQHSIAVPSIVSPLEQSATMVNRQHSRNCKPQIWP